MTPFSHLESRLRRLDDHLLLMAGLVEEAVAEALEALETRDPRQARRVIAGDQRIDRMHNQVEHEVITLLATRQPVAGDLRLLAAALKIAAFLERMGDQAVNLAQRTLVLAELEPAPVPPDLQRMGELARTMARRSLDALVRRDPALARRVIDQDDELDRLCRTLLEQMVAWMNRHRRIVRRAVELVLASRHLERVGDEATNIAEEVVFLVEGEVIRHQGSPADSAGPL